ncbi:MAG: hypothetical protein JNM18_27320 [Planctomycetaceae bacterium]|nr:hypothetical protein [Planctomycetaceae bacterium]
MSTTIAIPMLAADRLQRLSRLAKLMQLLRTFSGPLTTPENLRQALNTLLEVAGLVGLDDEWVNRLEQILSDENVFQIVLAVVRALSGWSGAVDSGNQLRVSSVSQQVTVHAQSFVDWLPIVVQLLQLLRQLRGDA